LDHLQVSGLPGGELNGVRSCCHDGFYGLRHILNACEKARLIEESVIDGDIEATAGFRVEETVQTVGFHKLDERK
jgi:hypothetical protein